MWIILVLIVLFAIAVYFVRRKRPETIDMGRENARNLYGDNTR